jgi:hypothetical protein
MIWGRHRRGSKLGRGYDNVTKTYRITTFLAVLATAALLVSGAAAKKPTGYNGIAGGTQGLVQKGAKSTPTKTVGSLPFTGMDLGIFAAGGVALILAGYSLSRASRKRG